MYLIEGVRNNIIFFVYHPGENVRSGGGYMSLECVGGDTYE